MDALEEYEDKFRRAGIKSPTKAEIESYRPWNNQEPSEALKRFSAARDHNSTMVPEKQATDRPQAGAGEGMKDVSNDSVPESDRKRLATRIRENMRVRNSFSFDPMAIKQVFAGMNIYVEIEDDDAEYGDEVRKLCTKLGGVIQSRFIYGKRAEQSLKPDVIVWHRGEYKTLEKAEANQIAVVNHNWVFECISKQAKLPFSQFKLTEYQKEEAKTRSELGIGTRRRMLVTTRKLVKNPIFSNSEQKVPPVRAPEGEAAGAPVQTHLTFTKTSDSARNLQDSKAVFPPTLASNSRLSNQTLPNSRRTLPSFQKTAIDAESSYQAKPPAGHPTQTKLTASAATTSTKPSTTTAAAPPANPPPLAASTATTATNPTRPKPRHTDSLADQMAEHLRALCADPSELRDLVLDNADLRRDLQLEVPPEPVMRKSVKPVKKDEETAVEEKTKPVQQTLNWDRVKGRISGDGQGTAGESTEVLSVTKFLRANNPQFMSSSKTASKWTDKGENSDSKSLSLLATRDFSKSSVTSLTVFYCGAFKTVSKLKGLKVSGWSGLSIIRSKNFHQYELKPEETVWFYDGSEPGDLGVLWAIMNKVPILSPAGVNKFVRDGLINLKESTDDHLVKVEWTSSSSLSSLFDNHQSKSRGDTSSSPPEIKLIADFLQKSYLSVFKSDASLKKKEYTKLVETLEAAVQSFGGKLTKDSYLLDIIIVTDDDVKSPAVLKQLQAQNSTGAAKVVRADWLVDSIFQRYKRPTTDTKYRIDSQK